MLDSWSKRPPSPGVETLDSTRKTVHCTRGGAEANEGFPQAFSYLGCALALCSLRFSSHIKRHNKALK